MKQIKVVGIGPGEIENITLKAKEAICQSDVIVGYGVYVGQIESLITHQETFISGMGQEKVRCEKAIDLCMQGKKVSVVCSGDPSLYGMAGLIYELLKKQNLLKEVDVEVVPGVSAAFSSAALLGAPIVEDFCSISLSDYMTPYQKILQRVKYAARADFVIALYNPRSKKRPDYLKEVIEEILKIRDRGTPVGIVTNAYREGQQVIKTCLGQIPYDEVGMFSTVIVGNAQTKWLDYNMVTSRGYTL